MGLMDMLGSAVSGASGGSCGQGSIMDSITGLIQQHGGLQGLTDKLKAAGLEQQVQSWIGTGANLPVSADQIKAALGSDTLKHLAQKAGCSPDATAHALSQHLPNVVDSLTPHGTVPQGNLEEEALSMLKSKFFS